MKVFFLILISLTLFSCGKNGKNGSAGSSGSTVFGANAISTGVDFDDILPGLACAAGGISIYTFHDTNSDGVMESGESVIKVKAVCNGVNGSNGSNGTNASTTIESVARSATCPNGGVKISSGSETPVEICNGANGLNGEQGIQGTQGVPGMAGSNGSDGTLVTPVKFCPKDESTYPEYGLMIGDDLYAVYWGTTPASPKTPQAFLTKLVAGQYMSTGGNNCLFSVE